jgi:hypothetical protein
MWIISFFVNENIPATGLSPVIRIRDIDDGTILVNDESMTEKGDGFYGYNFTTFDPLKNYTFRCDAVTLADEYRYSYGTSGEMNDTISTINTNVGVVDTNVSTNLAATTLIKKVLTNRLELYNGSSGNWILYDDDNITPLLTFSVTDIDDGPIIQGVNTPSKRTKGV